MVSDEPWIVLLGFSRGEAKNTLVGRVIKRVKDVLEWSDFASEAYS